MKVLVDTSVWVDHLKFGNEALIKWLNEGQVLTHPLVIGELACGRLGNREEILHLLRVLPRVQVASDEEVMVFVEQGGLTGRGLGWVDVNLLASAKLAGASLCFMAVDW